MRASSISDIIKTELGKYAGDYGFSLPNPVSIQPRVSPTKVLDSAVYANLKTKETWYRVLGHCDAEYDTVQRVFKGW